MQRHNIQEQSQLSWKAPKGVHLCMNWAAWIPSKWVQTHGFEVYLYSFLLCALHVSQIFHPEENCGWMSECKLELWVVQFPAPCLDLSFLPHSCSLFSEGANTTESSCSAEIPFQQADGSNGWAGVLNALNFSSAKYGPGLQMSQIWPDLVQNVGKTKVFFPRKTDSLSWRNCTVCDWV